LNGAAWGFPLAGIISGAGYAAGWLTAGGAAAALVVGCAVWAGSGWTGGALLVLFFVTGSLLTRATRRSGLASSESPERGRNAHQVWANGLCAAAGAILVPWHSGAGWSILTGALAAAQGDTWATEIGATSPRPPRMITTWTVVARGTSGAITLLGTLGGVAGAGILSGLGAWLGMPARAAAAGFIGGVIGMLTDSLLGATVQARFQCDACAEPTERPRHRCGRVPRHLSGLRWLDNDGVNLLACGAGGSVAALLFPWL
jgi:uncharacterized protein (TIGR00297 family)